MFLRTRYGLLSSYDPLESELVEAKRLQSNLKNIPAYIRQNGKDEIQVHLQELIKDFSDKNDLIQQFKSHNAVYNNSLYYFPITAKKFAEQASLEPNGINWRYR
jgi:hypothetical protein